MPLAQSWQRSEIEAGFIVRTNRKPESSIDVINLGHSPPGTALDSSSS
jgi:hypothetical protein